MLGISFLTPQAQQKRKSLFAALLPLRIGPLPVAPFPPEDSRIAQPEPPAAVEVATGRDFAKCYAKLFTGIGSHEYMLKARQELNCDELTKAEQVHGCMADENGFL